MRQGRHIWVICVWDESTQKEQRLIVPKGIFPTKEGRAQFTRFLAEQRRCPEGQEMRQPEDFCSAEDAGEPILAVSVVWNPERRKQLAAETARVIRPSAICPVGRMEADHRRGRLGEGQRPPSLRNPI